MSNSRPTIPANLNEFRKLLYEESAYLQNMDEKTAESIVKEMAETHLDKKLFMLRASSISPDPKGDEVDLLCDLEWDDTDIRFERSETGRIHFFTLDYFNNGKLASVDLQFLTVFDTNRIKVSTDHKDYKLSFERNIFSSLTDLTTYLQTKGYQAIIPKAHENLAKRMISDSTDKMYVVTPDYMKHRKDYSEALTEMRAKEALKDTYLASNVTRAKVYSGGKQEMQLRWIDEGEKVINEFIRKLQAPEFNPLTATEWLGRMRCMIAIMLGQESHVPMEERNPSWIISFINAGINSIPEEKRNELKAELKEAEDKYEQWKRDAVKLVANANWLKSFPHSKSGPYVFGMPRGIVDLSSAKHEQVEKLISLKKSMLLPNHQKDEIFRFWEEFVKSDRFRNAPDLPYICRQEEEKYIIEFKTPDSEDIPGAPPIMQRVTIEFNEDKPMLIDFDHLSLTKSQAEAIMKIADKYWKTLLDWPVDGSGDINIFLSNLAKLSRLYACAAPYYRGTAAITEWQMRGLAHNKGIELGAFTEKWSWDFKAFCSPDPNDYVRWFPSAFQYIKQFKDPTRVFHFPKVEKEASQRMDDKAHTKVMNKKAEWTMLLEQWIEAPEGKEKIQFAKLLQNFSSANRSLWLPMTYIKTHSNGTTVKEEILKLATKGTALHKELMRRTNATSMPLKSSLFPNLPSPSSHSTHSLTSAHKKKH